MIYTDYGTHLYEYILTPSLTSSWVVVCGRTASKVQVFSDAVVLLAGTCSCLLDIHRASI